MFGARMINGGFGNGSEAITAATIRYFRKYNVSYGSMFNNTMMPNILYGAAVFDHFVEQIRGVIDALTNDDNKQEGTIKTYLRTIDFKGVLNDSNLKLDANVKKNEISWTTAKDKILPNNIYASPSICGQLVKTFLDFITPGVDENKEEKTTTKPAENNMYGLIFSPVGRFVRLNDALSTYAYMFCEFLLHTGYYSETLEREVPYANIPVREPFQIV